MLTTIYCKTSIFVLLVAMLGATALVVNPGKVAYAQANVTATMDADVDNIIKLLKAKHPILAELADDADKNLVAKIKVLDAKDAVKTAIALNILRELMQYKLVDAQ